MPKELNVLAAVAGFLVGLAGIGIPLFLLVIIPVIKGQEGANDILLLAILVLVILVVVVSGVGHYLRVKGG